MTETELKKLFRKWVKVLPGGPGDKTRGIGMLTVLDALATEIKAIPLGATILRLDIPAANVLLTNTPPADQVQEAAWYTIDGDWNATGNDSRVFVWGLAGNAFSPVGIFRDALGALSFVQVDVVAATATPVQVDAYTKAESDTLLRYKANLVAGRVPESELPARAIGNIDYRTRKGSNGGAIAITPGSYWHVSGDVTLDLSTLPFGDVFFLRISSFASNKAWTRLLATDGKLIGSYPQGTALLFRRTGSDPSDLAVITVSSEYPSYAHAFVPDTLKAAVVAGSYTGNKLDTTPNGSVATMQFWDASYLYFCFLDKQITNGVLTYAWLRVPRAGAAPGVGAYIIQAADLPQPVITVPGAAGFSDVAIEDPASGDLNPLAEGSGWSQSGNVLTITAGNLQAGEVVHYKYGVASGGGGGSGPASFAGLTGEPTDNAKLATALDQAASAGQRTFQLSATASNPYADMAISSPTTQLASVAGLFNYASLQAQLILLDGSAYRPYRDDAGAFNADLAAFFADFPAGTALARLRAVANSASVVSHATLTFSTPPANTPQYLHTHDSGFRLFGNQFALNAYEWNHVVSCNTVGGTITANDGFNNSHGTGSPQFANSGTGLRMMLTCTYNGTGNYERIGFCTGATVSASGSNLPAHFYLTGGSTWRANVFGTEVANGPYAGELLQIEIWDDSIRWYVGNSQVAMVSTPPTAAQIWLGAMFNTQGASFINVQAGGQTVAPR